MNATPTELWPWLALAGLGAFHGINPAMGWLFAVALGLHRKSRSVVFTSLLPIALGHAAAISVVVFAVLAFGFFVDEAILRRVGAAILIGWAVWLVMRGHRQPTRIGMQAGLAGLALWSLLMATAHGAGLMLIPVVTPLCLSGSPAAGLTAGDSMLIALAAVGVHTAAMLGTIALISAIVYDWVGLAFLRSGWINLDWIWIAALITAGAFLVFS
jgi:hypothetical protein